MVKGFRAGGSPQNRVAGPRLRMLLYEF